MPNVQRGLSDFGAANPKGERTYPVAAATVISVGDLCFQVTGGASQGQVLPASSTTLWNSTIALTREALAEKFVGVAEQAHASSGANGDTVRIATRGVFKYPVGTASTFEVGDLVGGDQDAALSQLLAQSVEKVTIPAHAIGKVVRRVSVAGSLVEIEILGRGAAGGGQRAFLTS